jgi:hypothetical protein
MVGHVRRRLPGMRGQTHVARGSDDLTDIIEPCGAEFVVLRSPETAEHKPDYFEVGAFTTLEQAEAYVENLVDDEPGVSPSIAPM